MVSPGKYERREEVISARQFHICSELIRGNWNFLIATARPFKSYNFCTEVTSRTKFGFLRIMALIWQRNGFALISIMSNKSGRTRQWISAMNKCATYENLLIKQLYCKIKIYSCTGLPWFIYSRSPCPSFDQSTGRHFLHFVGDASIQGTLGNVRSDNSSPNLPSMPPYWMKLNFEWFNII